LGTTWRQIRAERWEQAEATLPASALVGGPSGASAPRRRVPARTLGDIHATVALLPRRPSTRATPSSSSSHDPDGQVGWLLARPGSGPAQVGEGDQERRSQIHDNSYIYGDTEHRTRAVAEMLRDAAVSLEGESRRAEASLMRAPSTGWRSWLYAHPTGC
jgi:hypothetical protein